MVNDTYDFEFIIKRTSYKAGWCVKLTREREYSLEFPPTKIYTVIFRDNDCKSMERKLKIEKLEKEKND